MPAQRLEQVPLSRIGPDVWSSVAKTSARDAIVWPWHTSLTRSCIKSQARSLLSIAKLNRARSRHRLAICNRTRIAQISLSLKQVFWPTSLPLFQGSRGVDAMISMIGSCCWGAGSLPFASERPQSGGAAGNSRPLSVIDRAEFTGAKPTFEARIARHSPVSSIPFCQSGCPSMQRALGSRPSIRRAAHVFGLAGKNAQTGSYEDLQIKRNLFALNYGVGCLRL